MLSKLRLSDYKKVVTRSESQRSDSRWPLARGVFLLADVSKVDVGKGGNGRRKTRE